jgi:hypothetical protein
MIMPAKNKSAFFNRDNELNYLKNWIHQEPNYLLFLYGPKSCGKTTLLMKFIEQYLVNKYYVIKHINLHDITILNYTDVIRAFFTPDDSKAPTVMKPKRLFNLFRLPEEIIVCMENKTLDPFVVMKKELEKKVKKGKSPVIIIDELQAIEEIYTKELRVLFNEFFNFFVALTKESHMCHVIVSGNNGHFLNTIYDDSRLSKSAAYFDINDLSKDDVHHWLTHLQEESDISDYTLTEKQIETIWNYLGGNIFEITSVLGQSVRYAKKNKISDAKLKKIIDNRISEKSQIISFYASIYENKRDLIRKILKISQNKQIFSMNDLKDLIDNKKFNMNTLNNELCQLIRDNILAFSPITAMYQLQGHGMYHGLERYVDSICF